MDSFAQLRNRRIQIRERIQRVLSIDQRVIAAWYTGSVGRGQEDAWSDLDLVLAIRDDDFASFWEDRIVLFGLIDQVVFVQRELAGNSILQGGSFQLAIYDGPVEVDWTAGPVSLAVRASDTLLIFDRIGIPVVQPTEKTNDEMMAQAAWMIEFFWAIAPIAAKCSARRDTAAAIRQIGLLEQSIRQLDDALRELHVDYQPLAISEMPERITPLIALDTIERLCDLVDGVRPFLVMRHVTTHDAMSEEMHKFIALVRRVISSDRP